MGEYMIKLDNLMLTITIEPHGTYAIYEQIVNQIKNQIVSGNK
jgi:hypothetical protein